MKKTLYVADLDGTLLDRDGMLSEYTIKTIRRITDADMLFTIATARSLQAANDLIWLLGLRLPSILTNGAMIFDTKNQHYIHVNNIVPDALPPVFEVLEHYKICGFLHTLQHNQISVYYRQFQCELDRVYHDYRFQLFQGRIYQVENIFEVAKFNTSVYMCACGSYENLCKAQIALERLRGVSTELYCDVYNNFYFIDIFPSTSTKAQGMLVLQQMTGAEELVAFGDNFTDMQMLLVADRAYVPRNGVAAARNIATEVLDYAHRDSVAHFLAREMGWE